MGSTTSANNTVLGRSVLHNVYITKKPIAFRYSQYEAIRYALKDYEEENMLSNPNIGDFEIKIPPGLLFAVISVNKRWSIDAGTSAQIYAVILNDVSLDSTTPLTDTYSKYSKEPNMDYGEWNYTVLEQSRNSILRSLMDKNILRIKGLICNVWQYVFFEQNSDNIFKINFDKPLIPKDPIAKHSEYKYHPLTIYPHWRYLILGIFVVILLLWFIIKSNRIINNINKNN